MGFVFFKAPLILCSSVFCKHNNILALPLTFQKSLLVFWGRVGAGGGVNFLLVPFVLIWLLRANSDSQFTRLLLNFSCLQQQSPQEVLSIFFIFFFRKKRLVFSVALKKKKIKHVHLSKQLEPLLSSLETYFHIMLTFFSTLNPCRVKAPLQSAQRTQLDKCAKTKLPAPPWLTLMFNLALRFSREK